MIKYKRQGRVGVFIFYLLGLTSFLSAQTMNDGSRYAENSVLASGKWIRMQVKENAIYKLTYDDIKKQGFSDPSKVKIYGYGGWILPEDFTKPYIDDLPEVAVYMYKGSDGVFSSSDDYLLFYGRGPTKWTYNPTNDAYEHENNPYSMYGSYFLTESDSGPKEMETVNLSDSSSGSTDLTTFDDYAVYEKDTISILNSGRELFGENFIKNSGNQSFSFTIPGITSDQGKARLSFAAAPQVITPVKLAIDGQDVLSLSINVPSDYYRKAYVVDGWGNWNGDKSEKTTATVTYNSSGQSVAFLNFIALNMKRSLQFYPVAYTFFRSRESLSSQNSTTYSIGSPTASCQVWDVTNNYDTRLMETTLTNNRMEFTTPASGNTLREFVMVDLSKTFPAPEFVGEVQNQNLHALPQTDMVIIAPAIYLKQAARLAAAHQQSSGLNVTVVDQRSVFNEFSSGTPDATAYRRFMKMFYDRAVNDSDKPKYLLLFGGGLFDNRHLTNEGSKRDTTYYLLTYQVKESVDEQTSYGTDDYFGFLDDNEGKNIASDGLDIGVGRFPVGNESQADDAVNKVISYMGNTQYGNWKNKLIFAADNTDSYDPNNFAIHATQADSLAKYVEQNYPEYMQYKYYIDAYKLVNINGKPTAPDANKGMLDQLNDGCFLLNYTGHGSTTSWSAEGLLNITDVRAMNFPNLPLWITATCDFGWFDGINTSGGEAAFLNKNSGAIALYTTSRVVNSWNNYYINNQLIRYLFKKQDGKHYSLGDILRLSKNQLGSDSNKLNFVLLGDPALQLNYPEWNVHIESINGNPVSDGETITLKALDKVTVSGVITDEAGNPADNFTGKLAATVFDSKQTIESIRTDNSGKSFSFTDYPGMIYSGNSNVTNGAFSFSFNVPLDVLYADSNGKMGLYAYDDSQGKDASGSFQQYKLGGTDNNLDNPGNGPEITVMFLNDEKFKDGDAVNETPFFYAEVKDENGINLSGTGLGHDLELRIDDNWVYTLNNYYSAVDITHGTVGFSIPELLPGQHILTFKVWNIYNVSTTDTLNFTVVRGYKPAILDLLACENPAHTHTFFTFSYNLPETVLNVEIAVYDLTGRTVWTYSEKGNSGYTKQYPIEWTLVDGAGNRVRPGIYIYRATIRTANSRETTQAKKIIVLGQ